jgi:MYXO-CTERM domain-containing protein
VRVPGGEDAAEKRAIRARFGGARVRLRTGFSGEAAAWASGRARSFGWRKLFALTFSFFTKLRVSLIVFAALAAAPRAHANGRFPNAQRVRELGPEALVVSGTYGLLVTTNGGKDFAYVCESEMFGKPPGAATMDPLLELGPHGSFVTGSLQGARVSVAGGCGFETIASLPRNFEFFGEEPPPGATPGRVADLTRRGAGAEAPLLALVSLVDEAGVPLEHRVYEARSGTDFSPIGEPIPAELVEFVLTLDAAPSDPDRLYVTGHRAREPVLARSTDGGESWEAVPIPAADVEGVLGTYLAAISPNDADRIYLRASRRRFDENGFYLWDDSLLVSDDAGSSFAEPIRHAAAMLGFALRGDGETVLCGYGDPRAEAAVSMMGELGIYAANGLVAAGELAFEHIVTDLDVNCLHASPAGLYACATEVDPLGVDPELEPDFHLGLFAGAGLPEARADFTPIAKLRDVRGPAPRSDGSAGPCDAEWQTTCASLFACDNDPRELDDGALVCESGAGGAGSGGAGSGGASGADDEAERPMWQGAYTCSCRSAGEAPPGPDWLFAIGWLFAIFAVWWHRFQKKCRP